MRQRAEGRLDQIADAALRAFSRGGLRQTQVADVAREAGLSAGTLYLYAEGKDALFGLALRRAVDAMPDGGEALPIRAPAAGEMRDLLAGAVARRFRWPALEAALAARPPAGGAAAELAAILGELFDLTSAERRLIWLLDRCALELPALAAVYAGPVKGAYVASLAAYARDRAAAGLLRSDLDPAAAARIAMEAVVWAAMHRHRDAMPPLIDDAAARGTVVAMVAAGLLPAAPAIGRDAPGH